MTVGIHPDAISHLINGEHGDPFGLLGPHPVEGAKTPQVAIRAFWPTAKTLTAVLDASGQRFPMERVRDEGFFAVTIDHAWPAPLYHFEAELHDGGTESRYDPYRFASQFGDMDTYLFREGRHWESYEKMGAHVRTIDGVSGVNFAVWAPNGFRVSVLGDFNDWDGRVHPMRFHPDTGIWEIFIPGLAAGTAYKYEIRSHHEAYFAEKTDPYGFSAELRPRTASLVADLDSYTWGDDAWMAARAERNPLKQPMSVYEVHLGSWRRKDGYQWLSYRELAEELVKYVKDMGYTHIELMPIAEHPLDMSWGYQVTGYYAVTSRYGQPQDFMYFVDQCHQNGIGVILDWVPAHFPKDGHALSYFDGTHLYEHEDTRLGEHPDWGTYIFNYGRNEVRNFLISNALFWLRKYHVDGLRVDAVSSMLYLDFGRENGEWIPNKYGGNENLAAVEFLKEANVVIHQEVPGAVTIAEESTSWAMVSRPVYLGGLGFTFKWNMGWMHDTLQYIGKDPIHRRWHHNNLTFSLVYAFTENFVLSLSHDEVVHGKGSLIGKIPGGWWQQFATMRLLHAYQVTHPGKQLTFMGGEFGQFREWSEDRSLDWHLVEDFDTHRNLRNFVRDLHRLYREQPALWQQDFEPGGFRWIEPNDAENSIFSYLRFADDAEDFLVIVCNFTPVPRYGYRIGVPKPGYYKELMNSDAAMYNGGNVGNLGGLNSEATSMHGFPQSLNLTVPPLAAVIFKWQANPPGEESANPGPPGPPADAS